MLTFWRFFWLLWFIMLVVGDPIAAWMSHRAKLGDEYTDTHMLVTHIGYGVRVGILAWLVYHFLVEHITS